MREHRYARFALHAIDEALAAARHDQVERPAEPVEHFADRLVRGERRARDRGFGKTGLDEAGDEAGVDCRRGIKAVRAAAQHHRVAALEAERARVRGDVGPAFENHSDDAERRRDALDTEPVWPLERRQNPPHRVRQGGNLLDAPGHRLDALRVERESIEKGGRQPFRASFGQIARVGGEDFGGAFSQAAGAGEQRTRLGLGGRVGDHARRGASFCADRAHRGADFGFGRA
jgi:hypothetical protein